MICNLIFDFDGVIIDTESTEFISWKEIFSEYGSDLEKEVWVDCIGRPHGYFDPYAYLEEMIGRKVDRGVISKRRKKRIKALNASLSILPGIEALIANAKTKDFGLGIVSSSNRSWICEHMERLGLIAVFNAIVCAEDTARHKPDPEPYLEALNRLACRPEEAIVFEDSQPGVRSAKAAGIPCVAIPSPMTRHMSFNGADLHLDSAAEISLEVLLQRFS